MKETIPTILKKLLPHLLVILGFIAIVLIYFQPTLEGKVLQQSDIQQWKGMAQELYKTAETTQDFRSAWSGSMFSGMPSFQFCAMGNPHNYLGSINDLLSLSDSNSAGPVFAGLICAYILFFLLTGNLWISIIGAIAFAFSSYNLIILQAGHVTKAWAIAYMPLVLSGVLLIFRKKFILGGALFALALSLEILSGHMQITYYLALLCVVLYIAYAIFSIQKKAINTLWKVTLTFVITLMLAVLPDIAGLYANSLMAKESTRGASELTQTEEEKASSGLDIEYAYRWSYGKGETFSLLIPNIRGGSSIGFLDESSHLAKEIKAQTGQQTGDKMQTYTYWGEQPWTDGPVYFGAIICFLFILGMFVIRNPMKWWILGATIFFIFLSWGKNFSSFNDFIFYHLPLYNKFRAPSMALVIPGLTFVLIAVWGLKDLYSRTIEDKKVKEYFIISLCLSGVFCLLFWIAPSVFFDFQSSNDKSFTSQVPDWYYSALILDRKSLLTSDALRSLIFILLSAGCLYLFWKKKTKFALYSLLGLAVLILVDLWGIDKRYVNDSKFINQKKEGTFTASVADKFILQDKDPSYRVFNLKDPFNETNTSYFHKSIGGYHAAKLKRYQELIEHRIMPEMQLIYQSFQNAKSEEDITSVFQECPTLNMLNMRYLIYDPGAPAIRNPYADGNAWFVREVKTVNNADEEIAALNTIDPKVTAVVDKSFADKVMKSPITTSETDTILMTSYMPNVVKYQSECSTEQIAVFSEIYFREGWKAFIDGKQTDYFRADWTLRAMNVPAGKHEIEFRFEPDTYYTLASIASISSLLLIALFIGALVFSLRKEGKRY